jgi:hypothetical protein
MDQLDDQSRVSDKERIEFLDNEINLCHTFLDLAAIDQDDLKVSAEARSKAQKGYDTAVAWIGAVRNAEERERLTAKLHLLQERLSGLKV